MYGVPACSRAATARRNTSSGAETDAIQLPDELVAYLDLVEGWILGAYACPGEVSDGLAHLEREPESRVRAKSFEHFRLDSGGFR